MEELFTFEQLTEMHATTCRMLRIMLHTDFQISAGYSTISVERFSSISENLVRNNFVPYIADTVARFKFHNIASDAEFDELVQRLPESYKNLFKEHAEKSDGK